MFFRPRAPHPSQHWAFTLVWNAALMVIVAGGIVASGVRYWRSVEDHVAIGLGMIGLGVAVLIIIHPLPRRA
jgi:hypothetical protein